MSAPCPAPDMSSPANLQVPPRPESTRERRSSIGRAFKRFKVAIQKIGGASKESTPQEEQRTCDAAPIDTLIVDDEPEESAPENPITSRSIDMDTNIIKDELMLEPILSSTSAALVRNSVHRERTRALFAKYGLSLEAHEFIGTAPLPQAPHGVLRVEKAIRMRIRYTCHMCQTTFGTARECRKCQHRRCLNCPRQPPKKPQNIDEDKENNLVITPDISDDDDEERWSRRTRKVKSREGSPSGPSKPRPSTGSEGPIPVVQTTKRACHKCEASFPAGTTQLCTNCGHLRCSKCPRDITSLVWPCGGEESAGNDGDVEPAHQAKRVYRKPRQRLRWICDKCSSTFLEGSKVCRECLHKQCDFCTRIPPKRQKADPDPDPEVVQRVQARLAGLTIPPTAEAVPASVEA